MKNRLVTGILFIVLGGLIALGPKTVFPVCGVHTQQTAIENNSKMDEHIANGAESQEKAKDAKDADGMTSSAMEANKVMKCHWTAQAEFGIGLVIALLGLFLLFFKSEHTRLGLSIALGLNGLLALLIPSALIGVCGNVKMACRSLCLPVLIILGAIVTAAAAANVFYLFHSNRKGQDGT